MNNTDILFQYHSTTGQTSLTAADLVFVAQDKGQTMVRSFFVSATNGASNNIYRIHHCSATEAPAQDNCVIRATASEEDFAQRQVLEAKLIMNPGDRLFACLHSGSGVTITGYGMIPSVVLTGNADIAREIAESPMRTVHTYD